ncbi:MAG: error-prone DNA polymerase [Alphaproteobacteria bacterium]|nr:error-prone DNA polymerase [Alphaproteobacteria bacterium]MDP7429720.1 error-prone DNA polymerase [Alphaproteobacteria bacterium]
MTGYAELQVTSNFSFLCGASHPEELVAEAAALGHEAVAITDRNTFAGVVRAHVAARDAGIRLLVGVRLDLHDAPSLLAFPRDREAYGRLSRLLTLGKRRAPKGECEIGLEDLLGEVNGAAAGQILIVLPPPQLDPGAEFTQSLRDLERRAAGSVYLAAHYLYRGDDRRRLRRLAGLAAMCATPLVATNDVLAHAAWRRPLQDVLTCIREHCTIDEAGWRLQANAERHLKPAAEMARLFADYPEALERGREIAAQAAFSLEELRYDYPDEVVPGGRTPQAELERLSWQGAAGRYPNGLPERVRGLVARELELIAELGYAPYFLTVHDIVRFARARGILCQGRGSAANSAVCYCLGITAVDPDRIDLLFERFVSAERNEPPDIDVDFEHERREEVIQYIYEKYGRDRAGLTATVISYRTCSAVREVCKALGLSQDVAGALVGTVWGGGRSRERLAEERVRQAGLDPADRRLAMALELAHELRRFPRHLSQHVGGFVITRGPLSELSPIANAAMADRTVIEWDKDDLDALGILKIDVLGLGMLSCVRKGFELIARHYGRRLDLASVPAEDSRVYDMLCRADSVGVFQVESRAQMSMLPRLKPRDFYDLVIEVAIVRPGPIQGDMVHPYLRRRSGEEAVDYPSPELEEVLGKTLGVPLFQEQAMRIAMVGAGFSASEADGLRRAMATFRRSGQIQNFRQKFIDGMVERGYQQDFAERCFKQIEGFGEYGFPESHAASFALLVYVSAWLKCHYPSAFAAALLNSQPMGFYAPAQIVRDARDHGVKVRPVDVNHSDWDCTLERHESGVALRLGLRQIKGCKQDHAEQLVAARDRPYEDVFDLWRRTGLPAAALEILARGDAYRSLGLSRRAAFWAVRGLADAPLPLFAAAERRAAQARFQPEASEANVKLPEAALGEQVIDDYAALRLSLKRHPLALLRPGLEAAGVLPTADLANVAPESWVTVAGLVICRQRPGTASGVVFVTIEDETGVANLVVWPKVFERYRKAVLRSRLMQVRGTVQREGLVIHLIAQRIEDISQRLGELAAGQGEGAPAPSRAQAGGGFRSRDFR